MQAKLPKDYKDQQKGFFFFLKLMGGNCVTTFVFQLRISDPYIYRLSMRREGAVNFVLC